MARSFMPTNVMPSWVKLLMLFAAVAAAWWCCFGPSDPTYRNSLVNQVSYSSGQGNGLQAKVGANIRQFVTNPLEPAALPDESTVILRDTGTNYYRNEPRSH
jgi:hypothetical protein